MNRIPIRTAEQLARLDDSEIQKGYWAARRGSPEPDDSYSYSYWHGWRNGRVDAGYAEPDDAQMQLADCYRVSNYRDTLGGDAG